MKPWILSPTLHEEICPVVLGERGWKAAGEKQGVQYSALVLTTAMAEENIEVRKPGDRFRKLTIGPLGLCVCASMAVRGEDTVNKKAPRENYQSTLDGKVQGRATRQTKTTREEK